MKDRKNVTFTHAVAIGQYGIRLAWDDSPDFGELRGMVANLVSSLIRIDREHPTALSEAQKQMLAKIIGWMAAS